MAGLLTNANYINNTIKPAIKQAIENKGVTVPSTDSFLDYADRIGEISGGGSGYQLKDLPTGSISTVNDAAPLPLNALTVSVEAVQDLHGYDYPWVGGTGKNKVDKNGTILDAYLNGETALVKSNANNKCVVIAVKANTTYTLSLTRTALTANDDDYQIGVYSSLPTYNSTGTRLAYGTMAVGSITSATVTTLSDTSYMVVKYANINNTDASATLDTLQLEEGSTATAYEPYENICPITGWSSATITNKNDLTTPTTTKTWTHSFADSQGNPLTVYGAEWNVTDGPLKNDHAIIVMDGVTSGKKFTNKGSGESNNFYFIAPDGYLFGKTSAQWVSSADLYANNMICTHYPCVDNTMSPFVGFGAYLGQRGTELQPRVIFGSSSDITTIELANAWLQTQYNNGTPLTFIYPIATPTTIPQQAESIRMLEGVNNLYADCGDVIEGEYFVGDLSEYEFYDYIQSDGTNLIDTTLTIQAGDVIKITYAPTSTSMQYEWGCLNRGTPSNMGLQFVDGTAYLSNGSNTDSHGISANGIYSDTITVASGFIASSSNPTLDILYGASMRLYSLIINGNAYLPAKKGNQIGLLDVANRTLLADSASGNAFTLGNKLADITL